MCIGRSMRSVLLPHISVDCLQPLLHLLGMQLLHLELLLLPHDHWRNWLWEAAYMGMKTMRKHHLHLLLQLQLLLLYKQLVLRELRVLHLMHEAELG